MHAKLTWPTFLLHSQGDILSVWGFGHNTHRFKYDGV